MFGKAKELFRSAVENVKTTAENFRTVGSKQLRENRAEISGQVPDLTKAPSPKQGMSAWEKMKNWKSPKVTEQEPIQEQKGIIRSELENKIVDLGQEIVDIHSEIELLKNTPGDGLQLFRLRNQAHFKQKEFDLLTNSRNKFDSDRNKLFTSQMSEEDKTSSFDNGELVNHIKDPKELINLVSPMLSRSEFEKYRNTRTNDIPSELREKFVEYRQKAGAFNEKKVVGGFEDAVDYRKFVNLKNNGDINTLAEYNEYKDQKILNAKVSETLKNTSSKRQLPKQDVFNGAPNATARG